MAVCHLIGYGSWEALRRRSKVAFWASGMVRVEVIVDVCVCAEEYSRKCFRNIYFWGKRSDFDGLQKGQFFSGLTYILTVSVLDSQWLFVQFVMANNEE
jgi:hypothetical protein